MIILLLVHDVIHFLMLCCVQYNDPPLTRITWANIKVKSETNVFVHWIGAIKRRDTVIYVLKTLFIIKYSESTEAKFSTRRPTLSDFANIIGVIFNTFHNTNTVGDIAPYIVLRPKL